MEHSEATHEMVASFRFVMVANRGLDTLLSGHSAIGTLCYLDTQLSGRSAIGTLCYRDALLSGRSAIGTLCYRDALPLGAFQASYLGGTASLVHYSMPSSSRIPCELASLHMRTLRSRQTSLSKR